MAASRSASAPPSRSRPCPSRSRRSPSRSRRSGWSTTTNRRRIDPMPERTGYLGLGSNVGDSEGHLRAALHLLPCEGVQILDVSSTYVTEPVGEILDQPDFLNAAVRIRTALEPEGLLDACKAVEAERGRQFDLPRHT